MDIISTWIYLDSPEERSEYPQVGQQSHLFEFQKTYWKCIAVFFACSVQFNPGRRHVLFTNKPKAELPDIDGLDLKAFLAERNVEVITIPMTWQTPPGYYPKWRNQFFVFDIFQQFEQHFAETNSAFLLLDSDCIIRHSLDELFADIRKNGLMVLPMPFGEDYDINGITRKDMRQIYSDLDGEELENVKRVNQMFPPVWEAMMQRFKEGKKKFHYEGPTLSYLYYKIGKFGIADRFIKRIWTSAKFSNVEPRDFDLHIWHVPAEKKEGIALLLKKIEAGGFFKKLEPELVKEMGGYLGIPKRTHYLNLKHYLKHTRLYRWLKSG
ncbi:MAG: hypothetical protein IPH31_21185 [Lewinellaceae bacterium]|nr:hypothetical protein [Lewinellaceae bacterium]